MRIIETIERLSEQSQNLKHEIEKLKERQRKLLSQIQQEVEKEREKEREGEDQLFERENFLIKSVVQNLGSSALSIEMTPQTFKSFNTYQQSSTFQSSAAATFNQQTTAVNNSNFENVSIVSHTLLARIHVGNLHSNSFIDDSFL